MKKLVTVISFILFSFCVLGQYHIPDKMGWWYEDRFGMFIHFGSYSYLERGEWVFSIEDWSKGAYQLQCSAMFNPTEFDAKKIVDLAKDAGMKYLVITAKHHEGFCMWDTKVESFKDSEGDQTYSLPAYTSCKRDILMELKQECDRQDIKFGLYYSILDWNHKSQLISKNGDVFSKMSSMEARTSYINDMKAQLKELVNRYNPAIMWFDGDWCPNPAVQTLDDWWNADDGKTLYGYLVDLKPSIIVNERVKRHTGNGDFECPEQHVPDLPLDRPWETCATLNGGWGFEKARENSYRSACEFIAELCKVVARDGNYLLNVSPRGTGMVGSKTVEILREVGRWMSINGEAIYGATRNPFGAYQKWGDITAKKGSIYLILSGKPQDAITIPNMLGKVKRIRVLGAGDSVIKWYANNRSLVVTTPAYLFNTEDIKVVRIDY